MTVIHPQFCAHSGNNANGSDWQPLREHLLGVADKAAVRARLVDRMRNSAVPPVELEASIAGLLHDLGKYRSEFQDYMFGRPVARERTYHKQAGAAHAANLGYWAAAFAIAGHHGGIPTLAGLKDAVIGDCGGGVLQRVWKVAIGELPELAKITNCEAPHTQAMNIDFYSRIILSCLVDADWEDTSDYYRSLAGLPAEPNMPKLEPSELLNRLMKYIAKRSAACDNQNIRSIRQDVLQACLAAAGQPTGMFSLTVPTGGGKTLSALAFALKHAIQHGKRRIIYVAPYLSIIDQNTQVICEALGISSEDRMLFAHHSLSEPDGGDADNSIERDAAARRAENWDAPLIVTTNVQFFESLFAHKPAACRKLHNLAGSVILLDECQSIPAGLVHPTCAMLSQLNRELQCSIVLCTATQPVFNHPILPADARLEATEIVPNAAEMFNRLNRVDLHWPGFDEYLTWPEVATRMGQTKSGQPTALCIVNSRRAAREIFSELKSQYADGIFHLSTSMCPAHRMLVLTTVRERLKNSQKCLLVSTQLIEAGVDVDFPLVMREMAPLEAIIQAAGRCNREGKLNINGAAIKGDTLVFRSTASRDEPARYFPSDQWYKAGLHVLENNFLKDGRLPAIDRPQDIHEYFTRLFHGGKLDAKEIQASRKNLDFPKVAEDYRIIREDSTAIVVGSWESHKQEIDELLEAFNDDPSRTNSRKLIPFQVNVHRHELASSTLIARPFERPDLRVWYGFYDDHTGMDSGQEDVLMLF